MKTLKRISRELVTKNPWDLPHSEEKRLFGSVVSGIPATRSVGTADITKVRQDTSCHDKNIAMTKSLQKKTKTKTKNKKSEESKFQNFGKSRNFKNFEKVEILKFSKFGFSKKYR